MSKKEQVSLEQSKPTARRTMLREVVREINRGQNLRDLTGQSKDLGFYSE